MFLTRGRTVLNDLDVDQVRREDSLFVARSFLALADPRVSDQSLRLVIFLCMADDPRRTHILRTMTRYCGMGPRADDLATS